MSEYQRIKKHNFDPFLIAKHTSYDQRSLLVPHIGNWLADINYWKAKKKKQEFQARKVKNTLYLAVLQICWTIECVNPCTLYFICNNYM